jgi:hypothetical protein
MNAFDIETYINEKKIYTPYCVCYNLNKKYYYYYYNDAENLIAYAIENIFNLIIKEVALYIHNLDFDGLLIISYLSKTNKYNYKTFIRDMSFYKIEINFENKKIFFICSYKIFPISLKKIAFSFTNLKKLPFPYEFSNETNLFYVGVPPSLKY